MRFRTPLAGLLLLTAIFSTEALADEPRLAVSSSARPLSIGRFNLLVGAEPGYRVAGVATAALVTLRLRFGITEDLELFASPVVQNIAPNFYEPALGVQYRFLRGPVEVGARVAGDLSLFAQPLGATLVAGVPIRLHAGKLLSFDLGAHLRVPIISTFGLLGLEIPVGVSVNVTDSIFVSATSGVRTFVADPLGLLRFPFTAAAGYTVASGDRPFVDITGYVDWLEIRNLSSSFTVALSAKLYLYL